MYACVFIFARICFLVFSITNMPFFGLQACVGNYQKISNTHVVTNNPPNFKNKDRNYLMQ